MCNEPPGDHYLGKKSGKYKIELRKPDSLIAPVKLVVRKIVNIVQVPSSTAGNAHLARMDVKNALKRERPGCSPMR